MSAGSITIIKGSDLMFKYVTGYKRVWIVTLIIVSLSVLAACSGPTQDNVTDTPATEQETKVDPPDNTPQPGQEPDMQEGDKGSDSSDSDQNGNGDDSKEASNSTGKSPDEILKGYYHAKIDLPSQDFELKDLDGNMVRLEDLKGNIIFLNFWATWCPPCRQEMPHMQTFHDKYKDEGIVILAVNPNMVENQGINNSEKAEKKAREYIEKEGFTFPVLLDSDDSVWAVYQKRGIPANYIIDEEGMVKYLKPGAFESVEEMEAFLEAVRAETP
jgi:cytochrome c-type biogenesis protein